MFHSITECETMHYIKHNYTHFSTGQYFLLSSPARDTRIKVPDDICPTTATVAASDDTVALAYSGPTWLVKQANRVAPAPDSRAEKEAANRKKRSSRCRLFWSLTALTGGFFR